MKEIAEYPHTCKACGAAAYVSPASGAVACSNASCVHADVRAQLIAADDEMNTVALARLANGSMIRVPGPSDRIHTASCDRLHGRGEACSTWSAALRNAQQANKQAVDVVGRQAGKTEALAAARQMVRQAAAEQKPPTPKVLMVAPGMQVLACASVPPGEARMVDAADTTDEMRACGCSWCMDRNMKAADARVQAAAFAQRNADYMQSLMAESKTLFAPEETPPMRREYLGGTPWLPAGAEAPTFTYNANRGSRWRASLDYLDPAADMRIARKPQWEAALDSATAEFKCSCEKCTGILGNI